MISLVRFLNYQAIFQNITKSNSIGFLLDSFQLVRAFIEHFVRENATRFRFSEKFYRSEEKEKKWSKWEREEKGEGIEVFLISSILILDFILDFSERN
ncbi:hypothetical protein M9H77_14240 [Catharanthus roseus]|uniref:Uncharacterized protein n=1 Tax=Catharanthus roseus TaxID=4058 RepID=A0ACC0BMH5_CATRO|nr:hypothetical protein M9H77_14240 [Catharanthus roseus]